jgi:molybdenum cofactor guanylyltransferase
MNERAAIVAVLAGGRGSRLGGDKALAVLGGQALISYPLAAAREAGLEAIVVAKRSSRLPSLAGRVRYEPELPAHPLCGIVRGLEYARERGARAAVVIACDMPLLTPGLLRWLAELPGTAMVQLRGRPQPALARVRCSQLPELRESLLSQRSLTEAIVALEPRIVDERDLAAFGAPQELCFNVNRPEELQRAALLLARRVREAGGEGAGVGRTEVGPGGDPA